MATQQEKLRILAVYGNAIVDEAFREALLSHPVEAAASVLGPLTPYEEETIGRVAALEESEKLEVRCLYQLMQGRIDCPRPPCPEELAAYGTTRETA